MALSSNSTFGNLLVPAAHDDDENQIRTLFTQVVDLGIDFRASDTIFSEETEASPSRISFDKIPESGLSYEELIQQFASVASKSSNWGSPNFLGFPDAANNVAGLAAALLIPLLNQNIANQEICSPEATFIEMEVVHWLRETVGYPVPETYTKASGIGGVLTLGGCLSNTIALLAAREKCFPGSGIQGIPVLPTKIRVLVPSVTEHYSIRSAMAWLSLGEKNVIRVPVDSKFHMDREALKQIIDRERECGNIIMASKILEDKNVWFHVDACHGSQLAFSEKHRYKLRGIGKADSITIDSHKTMLVPYNCSLILFRDPSTHVALSTNSDLILNTQWSLGRVTPFIGSKAFDALKIWSTIKLFGRRRLGQIIDERLELTSAIQDEVTQRPNLILLNKTDINSCMMVYIPFQIQEYCIEKIIPLSDADLEKINLMNRRIKDTVRKEGMYYIHGFPLQSCPHERFITPDKQVFVLRTMNGNPLSTIENAKGLLDRIERLGQLFFSEAGYRCIQAGPSLNHLRRAEDKLSHKIRNLFGNQDFVAVVYGSSALPRNAILSDIDLMVFIRSVEPGQREDMVTAFRSIMNQESILVDDEVPLSRKLSIPFELAARAAESGPVLDDAGEIRSICKTPEYLSSNKMLQRLIFGVLTTPNRIIAANANGASSFETLKSNAGKTLVGLIRQLHHASFSTTDEFVKLAILDGVRSGEQYLGYKDHSEVVEKLSQIFDKAYGSEYGRPVDPDSS
ncbi:unnamed protein product [Fusarium graminearum]|nr:unnamed protein product [Fusarium graminearum]